MLLACATTLTSLAGCGAQSGESNLSGGAASREAAVNAYIEALNKSDMHDLRLLSLVRQPHFEILVGGGGPGV
jgi:hypothetical protein